MKIEFEKRIVDDAIQKVSKIVGKHLTLPVLSCILLETSNSGVVVKSTNLDIGIEINIEAKVIEQGIIAVPAQILANTVSSIKDEKIIFEEKDGNLIITTKNNSAVIKCMQHEDFPSIPKISKDNTISISSKDLVQGFKSVWYSASISTIKPELGSVYITNSDVGLVFVATDSFRLAEKKVQTKTRYDFPNTLIPFKNVAEIIKLIDGVADEININFEKNQASFYTNSFYIVSRLVDGSFPDYAQLIPKNYSATVTLLKNDLINAIKVSNIFSDTLNQVKFKVSIAEKSIIIESKNGEIGEYKEKINASVVGDDLEINFNSKYIIDCMQSIVSESITLGFGGIGRPLVITGVSDKSFTYLVMPMKR